MMRGRSTPEDGIMFLADAPKQMTIAKREAIRVTRTLHCLDRLRPEWVGNQLCTDLKVHIGNVAGKPFEIYTKEKAITVKFCIEVKGNHAGLYGFDFKTKRTFEELENERYTVRFLCWVTPDTDVKAMYNTMCSYVYTLSTAFEDFTCFGVYDDNIGGHVRVSDEQAQSFFVKQVELGKKDITFSTRFANE